MIIHLNYKKYVLDYASLDEVCLISKYHYRIFSNQPYVRAWKITEPVKRHSKTTDPIGIITYTMPVLNCHGRRAATGAFFAGGDKRTQLSRLNQHVRRIGRVVIDPRYRGLGLAARLVRRTMPLLDISMVETTAVMGRLSGFFEQAGMRRVDLPVRPQAQVLADTLRTAGIAEPLWIDAAGVQSRIESLPEQEREHVEKAIYRFMGAYGRRRAMPPGAERTRFALSRLNARPAYYVWLNPKRPVEGLGLTPCPAS